MAKYATKAKENIFTQARYNAAKFNDRLNSREGASEELGIDRSRLARIELGSKNPFPDEVLMMSDIYNAPELKAHFCKYMCPLGKDFPEVESEDLDRISVKALSSFRKISKAKDLLLDITEDGMITEEEKGDLETIIKTLDEVTQITNELKIWAEKNIRYCASHPDFPNNKAVFAIKNIKRVYQKCTDERIFL